MDKRTLFKFARSSKWLEISTVIQGDKNESVFLTPQGNFVEVYTEGEEVKSICRCEGIGI